MILCAPATSVSDCQQFDALTPKATVRLAGQGFSFDGESLGLSALTASRAADGLQTRESLGAKHSNVCNDMLEQKSAST